MPNFLRLKDRVSGTSYQGRALVQVDEQMCAALGVECSSTQFYQGWVDWMPLYITNDWAKVREAFKDAPDYLPTLNWLAANFELDSYARIGRTSYNDGD